MTELVGAAIAAVAAVLYDAGYVLEKQALRELPPLRLTPAGVARVAGRSPRWAVGFAAMLAGLGLQVIALTRAPVAVVQPILAGGLIALAAAGSRLLGERLTRRHGVALGLVLVAVVAVAGSAREGTQLARRVPAGAFWSMAAVVSALAVLAALAARRSPHAAPAGPAGSPDAVPAGRAGPHPVGPRGSALAGPAGPHPGRPRGSALAGPGSAAMVAAAVSAGLLYGLGAVAEKAVSTRLAADGLVDGGLRSLATPYPWAFLAATLAGMVVFQVGLQAHPASLMAALTNTVSTVCALAGATVVFAEPALPPGGWALLRVAGFVAGAAAVAVLVSDPLPPRLADPAPPGAADRERTRPDHPVAP